MDSHRYCKHCGRLTDNEAVYCSRCGKPISDSAETPKQKPDTTASPPAYSGKSPNPETNNYVNRPTPSAARTVSSPQGSSNSPECCIFIVILLLVIYVIGVIIDYTTTTPQDRADRVVEASEEREKERTHGPKPGSIDIRMLLKRAVKDPNSLNIESDHLIATAAHYDGKPCWRVRAKVRAKNSFGGVERRTLTIYIKNGQLIGVEEY